MKHFRAYLIFLLAALCLPAWSQFQNPVTFSVSQKRISASEIDIIFSGSAERGWHIYSTNIPDGGPTKASFTVEEAQGAEPVGKLKPVGNEKEAFDPIFDMKVRFFEGEAQFIQRIRLTAPTYKLKGYLEFGACNDENCLPPTSVDVKVSGSDGPKEDKTQPAPTVAEKKEPEKTVPAQETPLTSLIKQDEPKADATTGATVQNNAATTATDTAAITPAAVPADNDGQSSWWTPVTEELKTFGGLAKDADLGFWMIFLLGFAGGLLALFTPCVWPIIPMTVSFFLKRTKDRRKGIRDAVTYGIAIIVIYVSLGLIITSLFGASALNDLSTNAVFNIFFFLLLLTFAASFLGGFEITLPASWSAAVDNKAESTTGLLSIFLMAFTLSLVSFSCTGPIIGLLLVQVSTTGSILAPTIGMLGFALALALPFTLFALFPAWLNSAPKGGSWMNCIKVTLGFLELAFALKFFSVADLAYGWHLLDRETFLSLWIVIFALLGMYLLGRLKFPHDDDDTRTTVPRFFLGLCSLSFAVYMVPGLWGAPLKAVSAFAPPMHTQDFNLNTNEVKPQFLDFEEGMSHAAAQGKPVFIDFTGHGCVNCRKMEQAVWTDPTVAGLLSKDYVLISLYVDDKTKLPEPIEVEENGTRRTLRTVGDKWSYLQRHKFGANAQPYYVLLDNDGKPLNGPRSYDEDTEQYIRFLRTGLDNYRK